MRTVCARSGARLTFFQVATRRSKVSLKKITSEFCFFVPEYFLLQGYLLETRFPFYAGILTNVIWFVIWRRGWVGMKRVQRKWKGKDIIEIKG
jgi:hypothetical protein